MSELGAFVDLLIGPVVAALLTIMVLSYLVGDNPFFRVATYSFIGVAAGFAGALTIHSVIWPSLIAPVLESGIGGLLDVNLWLTVGIPALLVVLLFLKLSPGGSRLGSFPVALMVGVGAAVVVGGAITGTLLPQSAATIASLNPLAVAPRTGEAGIERLVNAVILLIGTLATLASFRFTTRAAAGTSMPEGSMGTLQRVLRSVGGVFIAITFGVLFGGALMASLVVLAQRVQFLWATVLNLLGQLFG